MHEWNKLLTRRDFIQKKKPKHSTKQLLLKVKELKEHNNPPYKYLISITIFYHA